MSQELHTIQGFKTISVDFYANKDTKMQFLKTIKYSLHDEDTITFKKISCLDESIKSKLYKHLIQRLLIYNKLYVKESNTTSLHPEKEYAIIRSCLDLCKNDINPPSTLLIDIDKLRPSEHQHHQHHEYRLEIYLQ